MAPASPLPAPLTLTLARGRIVLVMTCVAMGRDLAVTLGGGEAPHIGAVAVARAGASAGASVIALPGHREDELARSISSRLARRLDAVVCVTCGIHLDAILKGEIQDIQDMAAQLTEELIGRLASDPTAASATSLKNDQ